MEDITIKVLGTFLAFAILCVFALLFKAISKVVRNFISRVKKKKAIDQKKKDKIINDAYSSYNYDNNEFTNKF